MAVFPDTYPDPYMDPPPGVGADFDIPNHRGTAFIVVCILFFILATAFGGIRVYTKAFITRAMGWDDVTCILTMVCNVFWTVANINMANLAMGLELWNAHMTYREWDRYHLNIFIANLTYFVSIMFVKMSILLLYLRTFTEGRVFRNVVYTLLFTIVVSHVSFAFCYIFFCLPVNCAWTTYETEEEDEKYCTENINGDVIVRLIVFISVLTVLLDLIILVLPCRAVWRLHLPFRQKLVILITLISGVVVTLASILRLVYLIRRFWYLDNDTLTEWQVNLISTLEINIALICICLPVLKAFTRRFFPSLLQSTSRSDYGPGGSSAKRMKPLQISSHHQARAGRKRNTDSHEEELVGHGGGYLELGEDGKSDQNIDMNVIKVKTAIDVESRAVPSSLYGNKDSVL